MGDTIHDTKTLLPAAKEDDFTAIEVLDFLDRDDSYLDDCISITFNPCDQQQYFDKPNRLECVQTWFRQLLAQYIPKHIKYDMFTEVAIPHDKTKPEQSGRIHFHGIFYFRKSYSRADFYINVYQKLNTQCIINFDTIFSISGWFYYLTKDIVMKAYCDYHGFPWHFSERNTKTDSNIQLLDEESALIAARLNSYKYLDYSISNDNKYKRSKKNF